MGDNMTSFRKDGLPKSKSGLFGFVSPDGIHWRKVQDTRIFTDGSRVFDSQNVAFWSESEKRYVPLLPASASTRRPGLSSARTSST